MTGRRRWRNTSSAHDSLAPVRERIVVHSYKRATGESIEIILNEFCTFVSYCDGRVIHSELRSKSQGPHTPRTAKKRALAYEQQDHDEYNRLIAHDQTATQP